MSTIADAIAMVRRMVDDTSTSHRCAPDDLSYQVDGTKKTFVSSNGNVLAGALASVDGAAPAAVTPTDAAFGMFAFSSAPTVTLELFYNYQWFTDTDMGAFIDQALSEMNYTQTDLATAIPSALYTAMGHLAAAAAFENLMSRFARQFSSSVEGQSYEKSDVFRAYKDARDKNQERGKSIRDDYWKAQGRSYKPAYGTTYNRRPQFPQPGR